MSRDEVDALAREYLQTRNPELREDIARSLFPMVFKVAYTSRSFLPIEDKISHGAEGLVRAIDNFNGTGNMAGWAWLNISGRIRAATQREYAKLKRRRRRGFRSFVFSDLNDPVSAKRNRKKTFDPDEVLASEEVLEQQVELKIDIEKIDSAMRQLKNQRDREIMWLYAQGYNNTEIGKKVGLSSERIRQLLVTTARRVRQTIEN